MLAPHAACSFHARNPRRCGIEIGCRYSGEMDLAARDLHLHKRRLWNYCQVLANVWQLAASFHLPIEAGNIPPLTSIMRPNLSCSRLLTTRKSHRRPFCLRTQACHQEPKPKLRSNLARRSSIFSPQFYTSGMKMISDPVKLLSAMGFARPASSVAGR